MLDAIELPILLKAIDFIFDEGRKILEERRERRKAKDAPAPAEEKPAEAEPALPAVRNESKSAMETKAESKEELLSVKVDEGLWKNYEAEVGHLVRLLQTYSQNYQIEKEQYAKWGSALVPPIVVHTMTEAEDAMIETIEQLEAALSKLYNKDIRIIE